MFRLFRLAALLALAFLAGMLAERSYQKDRCLDHGGSWSKAGFCDRG
ncbi:hypothetical protein [Paracoccus onubensis]|nr:hypothetical protein [Paracoccus onubensis]